MNKNRLTLKDYFKKGAIPTADNFADLIDSMLNQSDDGISKPTGEPLKIIAAAIGSDEALINFVRIEKGAEQPSWQIKQKTGGVAGLSISDSAASRLFIENGTGKIGIGTTIPGAKLDVNGDAKIAGNLESQSLKLQAPATNGMLGLGSRIEFATSGAYPATDTANAGKMKVLIEENFGLNLYGTDTQPVKVKNTSLQVDGGLTVKGTGISSFAGNLGIGTTTIYNPQSWGKVLDILGASHARLNVRSSGGVVTSMFSHDDWSGARGAIGTESNHPLTFVTNYIHRMMINTDGSVGIGTGTTAPNYKLEVAGDISVGQQTTTPATGYGSKLYFNGVSKNSDPLWMARYNQADNTTYLRVNLGDDDSGDQFQIGYTFDYLKAPDNTVFHSCFTVETNGNVSATGYLATKQVYFSAYVDLNSRSGNLNPLPMGVASQNVGGGYDTATSTFKAPVKGVYLFTMTGYKAEDAGTLHWYLLVNGASANAGGTSTEESNERTIMTMNAVGTTTSRTMIIVLNVGDKVTIQQAGAGRVDNYRSGLEGVLLSAIF